MAETVLPEEIVQIECVCGEAVRFEAQLLGRIIACPHCKRYLRPALQFLLVDKSWAPNLTVQCACGRFVVAKQDTVGKRVRCKVCKQLMIMPQPTVRTDGDRFVRVPRRVLEKQLNRAGVRRGPSLKEMARLQSAAHAGRITLRPGEHICVNLKCGALLRSRANVCSKCGTNRLTGRCYKGPGLAATPRGKWRQV